MSQIKSIILTFLLMGLLFYSLRETAMDIVNFRTAQTIRFDIKKLWRSFLIYFCVLIILSCYVVIPAGHRGVIFSQFKGIKKFVLNEGIGFIIPLVESPILMDVRVDKKEAIGTAASKDLQDVAMDLLVNYHPLPDKVNTIYQTIGDKVAYENKIIDPAVQETVKSVTPLYTAAEIIQKRHEVKEKIRVSLKERLLRSNINLVDISIVDVKFDERYAQAIEDKVTQEQIVQKEELIVKQKEAQARQRIAEAEGIKKSAILRAEGEAQANKLLSESITPMVLQIKYYEKWDGQLPTYMAGGAPSPLLLLPGQNE